MRLLKLVLAGVLSTNSFFAFGEEDPPDITPNCVDNLTVASGNPDQNGGKHTDSTKTLTYSDALADLKTNLPILFPDIKSQDYFQVLDRLLSASQVEDGGMVLMAIIGPAAMGKSTLANAIGSLARQSEDFHPSQIKSEVGPKPGLTVRPLIFTAKADSPQKRQVLAGLRARYGVLERYTNATDPTRPGPALIVELDELNDFPLQPYVDTPDMTTGDPRMNLAPDNQQTARDALLPAEIMLVMLSEENIRDFPLRQMLMENFKKYGVRKSIFVLKTDAETEEEFTDIREWLLETIRSIYGFAENQDKELREAVLGMYAMQKKRAVRLKQEHPRLIPLDNSKHFSVVMNDISENTTEIRGFAGKKAAELIHQKVGAQVNKLDMETKVKKIYAKALAGVLEVAPETENFPYNQARDQWRALFSAQTPKSSHYLDKTANLAGKALKLVPRMSLAEEPLEKVLTTLDQDLNKRWKARLTEILVDLRSDQVRVPEAIGKELEKEIDEFNAEYENFKVREVVLVADPIKQQYVVALPSQLLLPAKEKEMVATLIKPNQDELLRKITETPDGKDVQIIDVDEVITGLRSVLGEEKKQEQPEETVSKAQGKETKKTKNEYEGKAKARDIVADVFTVGGPLTALVKTGLLLTATTVTGPAAAIALAGTAATGVGAAFLRIWRENKTDTDLKPKLQIWFKEQQAEEFKMRLGKFMLKNVIDHVVLGTSGPKTLALEKVRTALEALGVETKGVSSTPTNPNND